MNQMKWICMYIYAYMCTYIYYIKQYRLYKKSQCTCKHEEVLQAYYCLNFKKSDLLFDFISILHCFILKFVFCYTNSYANVIIAWTIFRSCKSKSKYNLLKYSVWSNQQSPHSNYLVLIKQVYVLQMPK